LTARLFIRKELLISRLRRDSLTNPEKILRDTMKPYIRNRENIPRREAQKGYHDPQSKIKEVSRIYRNGHKYYIGSIPPSQMGTPKGWPPPRTLSASISTSKKA
jgi:hypothetical protein